MKTSLTLFLISLFLILTSTIEAQTFTIGSSRDDVIRIQGTPDAIFTADYSGYEEFRYEFSTVKISLKTKKVLEWSNLSENLKVRLNPGANTTSSNYYTKGSHRDDVLRIQGTPDAIFTAEYSGYEEFRYDFSTVKISLRTKQVLEWNNLSKNLKVRLEPSDNNLTKGQTPQKKILPKANNVNISNNEKSKISQPNELLEKGQNSSLTRTVRLKKLITDLYYSENPEKAQRLNDDNFKKIIDTYNGDFKLIIKNFYAKENPEKRKRLTDPMIDNIAQVYDLGLNEKIIFPGNLKSLYYSIKSKNPQFEEYGFDAFTTDMNKDEHLRTVFEKLSANNPYLKEYGFYNFKSDVLTEPITFTNYKRDPLASNSPSNNKISETNIKTLYKNLLNSGRVTSQEIGDFQTFYALTKDPENIIKLYNNLRNDKLFKIEEIGTKETFLLLISQSEEGISHSSPSYFRKETFQYNIEIEHDLDEGNELIRSFENQEKKYNIPLDKVESFLNDMPFAEEVRVFKVGEDIYDIPIIKVPDFLKDIIDATPVYPYPELNIKLLSCITDIKKLHHYLIAENSEFNVPFEQFQIDMQVESKLKRLHSNLYAKDNLIITFTEFKKNLLTQTDNNVKTTQNENIISQNDIRDTKFLTEKIKVGDTEIELPIPSSFVRVDNSIKEQLEIARLLVPENNSLISFYLGDKDFGHLISFGYHNSDKYILVEVMDDLKYKKIEQHEFTQLLKSIKKDYNIKFDELFKRGSGEVAKNISEYFDRDLNFNSINAYPLGIYFESKNILSTGTLSKTNYSYDGIDSNEDTVVCLSSIVRINQKVVYLYLYKKFNNQEDLDWIKEVNENWMKEIEAKQSPTNFLTEFDFDEFKELIFAIIFLSFIGTSYFVTRRIYTKIKKPSNESKPNPVINDEFVDFKELLITDNSTNPSEPLRNMTIERKDINLKTNPQVDIQHPLLLNEDLSDVEQKNNFLSIEEPITLEERSYKENKLSTTITSHPKKLIKKKWVLYTIASITCVVLYITYIAITVLLGFKHGGGALPMVLFFSFLVWVWRKITVSRKEK